MYPKLTDRISGSIRQCFRKNRPRTDSKKKKISHSKNDEVVCQGRARLDIWIFRCSCKTIDRRKTKILKKPLQRQFQRNKNQSIDRQRTVLNVRWSIRIAMGIQRRR